MNQVWLLENIRDFYCKFSSMNESECLSNVVYSCFSDNCFDEITTNILCINENCQSKITQCLLNEECGSLYLDYLENKDSCYETQFISSNETCRCKQEGDNDNYYDNSIYSNECQDLCQECNQNSYNDIPLLANDASSSSLFLDIFSCLFQDCSTEYNEYIKPDISISNIVNDIEQECNYSLDDELCSNLYVLCWADYDCFNAFFVNYDNLMNILSNNANLINNNFLVQIQTDFEIINKSISKYHCDSNFNGYSSNDFVCNDIFYNLIDCILNKCIFENDDNICYSSSCKEEINNCLYVDNEEFNTVRIEDNPAICYQGLYWLSWTYFNKDNNNIILDYIQYIESDNIDCNANSNTIQCYYYNIVAYCIKNICTDSFWNIIDCIFKNECIGSTDSIDSDFDYSLSGTTLNIFNDDDICLIGTYRYLLELRLDNEYNACQVDFYKYFNCKTFGFAPNNSTLYLQDLTSYNNYNNLYGQNCIIGETDVGFIDGLLYFYPDCSKKVTVKNAPAENDRIFIYMVSIYQDIDLFNKRDESGYNYYPWTTATLDEELISDKTYTGNVADPVALPWDGEYLFGICTSNTAWSTNGWEYTSYTSLSPTNSPTNEPTQPTTANPTINPIINPTYSPTNDDTDNSAYNIHLFFVYFLVSFVVFV